MEKGFLDPKELVRGVVDQTRDIILLAFHWTSGDYRLDPGPAPGEAITLDMSTPQLILDGISQIEAWSRVERGSGGLAARYAPVPGSEGLFKQLTLDVDQAALLRSVKGARDVESLLRRVDAEPLRGLPEPLGLPRDRPRPARRGRDAARRGRPRVRAAAPTGRSAAWPGPSRPTSPGRPAS